MNNDIKERLNNLDRLANNQTYAEDITEVEAAKLLLDYITNLQQKLEYYKNIDPDKTIDKFRQKINKEMFNLQEELKSSNESITWWQNRFNALQEENKNLKHKLEQMYNDTKDTYNEICAEQVDYKSRNEKAIEYIKEHTLYSFDLYDKDDVSSYFEKASPKDLLNILQGDDESENKSNK